MPAMDVNPRTKPNSDSAPRVRYWRPAGLPHVEVLERRDTPAFRGYSSPVCVRLSGGIRSYLVCTIEGRLHEVPPGARSCLCEPWRNLRVWPTRPSVIILLISPDMISAGSTRTLWKCEASSLADTSSCEDRRSAQKLLAHNRSASQTTAARTQTRGRVGIHCQLHHPIPRNRQERPRAIASPSPGWARAPRHATRSVSRTPVTLFGSRGDERVRLQARANSVVSDVEFGLTPHQYLNVSSPFSSPRSDTARSQLRRSGSRRRVFMIRVKLNRHFIKHVGITPGVYARGLRPEP